MRILYHPRKSNLANVNFGLLYNGHVVADSRNIMPLGWHIPTEAEYQTLLNYLGGNTVAGGKLKEAGTTHWATGNTGTNLSGLGFRGAGYRTNTGVFTGLSTYSFVWTRTPCWIYWRWLGLSYSSNGLYRDQWPRVYGASIRGVKDTTSLTDGETSTMTDNDGLVYKTKCVGTQEWMMENMKSTKYRNGDTIPRVTDATAWAALTTGALCAYNNDINNV